VSSVAHVMRETLVRDPGSSYRDSWMISRRWLVVLVTISTGIVLSLALIMLIEAVDGSENPRCAEALRATRDAERGAEMVAERTHSDQDTIQILIVRFFSSRNVANYC
jgi:hypothetical protein